MTNEEPNDAAAEPAPEADKLEAETIPARLRKKLDKLLEEDVNIYPLF